MSWKKSQELLFCQFRPCSRFPSNSFVKWWWVSQNFVSFRQNLKCCAGPTDIFVIAVFFFRSLKKNQEFNHLRVIWSYLCEGRACPQLLHIKWVGADDFFQCKWKSSWVVVNFQCIFDSIFKFRLEFWPFHADTSFCVNWFHTSNKVSTCLFRSFCLGFSWFVRSLQTGPNLKRSNRNSSFFSKALCLFQSWKSLRGSCLQARADRFCFFFIVTLQWPIQTVNSRASFYVKHLFCDVNLTFCEGCPCHGKEIYSIQSLVKVLSVWIATYFSFISWNYNIIKSDI